MISSANCRITEMVQLTSPNQLLKDVPVTNNQLELIKDTRTAVENIIKGESKRLVVVAGPCSIHDDQAALEYARFIAKMREKYGEHLEIIMRTYFTKPRTTVGWKGYLYDPHINGSNEINTGIRRARELLQKILDMGVPCSMEHLDSITPQYFGDLLSWAAIGARTTESQIHREIASGISTPLGFKNGTGGGVELAVNAVKAASMPHSFMGCNDKGEICSIKTSGNPYCHIILRGGSDGPNYEKKHVDAAKELLAANQSIYQSIFIDFSHGNSEKQHKRQIIVCESVAKQIKNKEQCIHGVMIESNLVEGSQSEPIVYGKSITDACINLSDTEDIFDMLSRAVAQRIP